MAPAQESAPAQPRARGAMAVSDCSMPPDRPRAWRSRWPKGHCSERLDPRSHSCYSIAPAAVQESVWFGGLVGGVASMPEEAKDSMPLPVSPFRIPLIISDDASCVHTSPVHLEKSSCLVMRRVSLAPKLSPNHCITISIIPERSWQREGEEDGCVKSACTLGRDPGPLR
jgi:hypothetical protein